MSWFENPVELLKLVSSVLVDVEPAGGEVQDGYLFGNTPDLENSILAGGLGLISGRRVQRLYLPGGEVYSPFGHVAYNGFTVWRDWFVKRGVESEMLTEIPRAEPISHTGTEAERLVNVALETGMSSIYIVAHPLHALRAFTNTVTFIIRLRCPCRVYMKVGAAQDWHQEGLHSQGAQTPLPLVEHVAGELERLERWHAKGDLVSAGEVLKYLAWRDSI